MVMVMASRIRMVMVMVKMVMVIIILAFPEHLQCTRHCAMHCTCINSFHLYTSL